MKVKMYSFDCLLIFVLLIFKYQLVFVAVKWSSMRDLELRKSAG